MVMSVWLYQKKGGPVMLLTCFTSIETEARGSSSNSRRFWSSFYSSFFLLLFVDEDPFRDDFMLTFALKSDESLTGCLLFVTSPDLFEPMTALIRLLKGASKIKYARYPKKWDRIISAFHLMIWRMMVTMMMMQMTCDRHKCVTENKIELH